MLPRNNLHKYSIFLLFSVLFCFPAFAQKNYIRVYVPQAEISPGTVLNSKNSLISTSYYDSAGRLIQTVQQGITPLGKDIANHIIYDSQNRKECEWQALPFSTSDGLYKPLSTFESSDYKDYYHVEYEYEPSVLNRITAEVGRNSKGKSIRMEYLMNTPAISELSVYHYTRNSDTSIKNEGVYPAGFLNCIKQTDEDGNILYTFTNPEKKVILERHTHISYSENSDTYYIYDNLDELFCVLPPAASDILQSTSDIYTLSDNDILDRYAYFYHYDGLNNCVATKLPGSGWYYTVYDGDCRPVLKQSPNQRSRNEWTFIKYDGLNRIILEGTVINTQSHTSLIKNFSTILVKETFHTNMPYGYTENINMGNSVHINKAFYYDYYDFISLPLFSNLMTSRPTESHAANSLQTGSYITTLDTKCDYEVSVNYYDQRGRSIQTDTYNSISNTNTQNTSNYNFVNNPINQHTTYITSMEVCTEELSFEYDHAGREVSSSLELFLASGKLGINKSYSLQNRNYDEFGRISHQDLFNNKDQIATTYRIDGKLNSTFGNIFSQVFYYDEAKPTPYGDQYFNGRISSIATRQCDNSYRIYHQYDYAGRLSSAMMYNYEGNKYLRFKEEFGYDKMGNITSLYRTTPKGDVNVLSLSYNGNQIVSTEDYSESRWPDEYDFMFCRWSKETNAYLYDENGNESRNIARDMLHARYNNLNLPDSICFSGGNTLQMSYLSDGRRVRTTSKTYRTALTIPLDDVQILSDPSSVHEEIQDGNLLFRDGYLSELRIPGGYISLRNDTTKRSHIQPYYYITDYLGSVRATCDGETGSVLQSMEYLPSGAIFRRTGYDVQSRRFCGKEELAMHGFDMYDSDARLQYTRIPRFSTMDPLLEKYYHLSPYAYCANDFTHLIDPDGRKIVVGSFWGRVKAFFGADNFESQVQKDLSALKEMSPTLDRTITDLEKSDKTVNIILTGSKNRTIPENKKDITKKQGSTIEYNPQDWKTNTKKVRTPIIGLAHELGHAEDLNRGKGVRFNRTKAATGNNKEDVKLGNKSEENAIRKENIVRKYLNVNERKYDYYPQ